MDASGRHDSQLKVSAVRRSTAYRWRVAYKETRETMKRDRSINQEGRKEEQTEMERDADTGKVSEAPLA